MVLGLSWSTVWWLLLAIGCSALASLATHSTQSPPEPASEHSPAPGGSSSKAKPATSSGTGPSPTGREAPSAPGSSSPGQENASSRTHSGHWWEQVFGRGAGGPSPTRPAGAAGGRPGSQAGAGRSGSREGAGSGQRERGGGGVGGDEVVLADSVQLPVIKVAGSSGEIARILEARNHFAVLDLDRGCSALDVKKAYRSKQMATHPDKHQGSAGAVEASQRVNAANEVLGDEVRRRQYSVALEDEEQYGPRSTRRGNHHSGSFAAFDEFVRESMPPPPRDSLYPTIDPAAYDTWGEAPDHAFRMACQCGYDHLAIKVPGRTASQARRCKCSQCGVMGRRLPARDNDVWFECSNSLLLHFNPNRYIKAYRCVGIYVYEVTAWCRCNGLLMDPAGNPAPTDIHYVPFKLGGPCTKGGRQRATKREKETDANFGFNQFKGRGVNSHKQANNKKKRK
ncbi:hypothetical protein V8C86DRAFT_433672 [Haematococcus lacustris]